MDNRIPEIRVTQRNVTGMRYADEHAYWASVAVWLKESMRFMLVLGFCAIMALVAVAAGA